MRGTLPASRVFNTRSALLTQVAVISLRYLELAAPSFFCSGMATAMFPASSTMWPMASRRASSPATRTAEGPMSTPRRDWPRSSGTPITRIWRGVMLLKVVLRSGIAVLSSRFSVLSNPSSQILLRAENWELRTELRVQTMEHAREGDGLANVLQSADPCYGSLDPHAEAGVGNAAVLSEIKIP